MNDDEGMSDGHNDQTNGECSAAKSAKDIKFNIHHKYTTHSVVVSDRSTIGWFIHGFFCCFLMLFLRFFFCFSKSFIYVNE